VKKFPDETPEIVRAIALYRRIYGGTLPRLYAPLEKSESCEDFSHRETLLWAGIGRKLAKKEPEFSPGKRRQPGSKNKKPLVEHEKARRKWRRNKKRRVPGHPDLELEEGQSLDPVWKR
jgi:hypothetical protein